MQEELSRPVRKQDVHFDYLPTQFLCEFIKYKGFDAIEYSSSMSQNGYNLAIFNDGKFECINSIFVEIDDLTYSYSVIE